jgi:thiol-disulfide isomerase/thioredoxin
MLFLFFVFCFSFVTSCSKELTSEDVRDVMLYLRDAMTAHVMPRTIADNADAFLAWGKEELAKVPAPSNEKDGKDFDWSALKDEATIALDDASFNAHVAKGDTLVDFYATWCPACQQLAPVWAEVAKSLPQARFAKVDVDKGVLTSTLYAVESLPTIVLLRGDRYLTYEGDRTKEAIVAFATANHVSALFVEKLFIYSLFSAG